MKVRADSTRILDQIKVPTKIFHGADDQIITLRESEIIHSGITNSSLQIVPNAGHLLNLEQPGVFNDTVANFLSSI